MATQLYETDFYGWTQEQAAKLRKLQAERSNLDLDLVNIAEEIDSMGRSDKRELRSRLEEIDIHLMKLAFALNLESRRLWENSVRGQRRGIEKLLEESPSLRRLLVEELEEAHDDALRHFTQEKLIQLVMPDHLPASCPFDLDQMLDPDWWPETRATD
jgi:hypothetical protein